ncbi:MAG: hypothetical protein EON54_07400 [Alcaligenaceae bacterium]|nr:MAG: hypothetical protein EON54_07400 [Alcaligenaceae bacterium]
MATTKDSADAVVNIKTVGLVMPISGIDNCGPEHWAEVKSILEESVASIQEPKFSARLVSDADDIGVIQKRIIAGVYSSDIVVCDVSGKNSNVMFELGMRLAFDKPVVIIKDDKTDYSFDTSIIEHLGYPRDLRFHAITAFKRKLADKIVATHQAATDHPDKSSFLKSFGTFNVAKLDQKEVTADQAMMAQLSEIHQQLATLRGIVVHGRNDPGPVESKAYPTIPISFAMEQIKQISSVEMWEEYKSSPSKLARQLLLHFPELSARYSLDQVTTSVKRALVTSAL